ncbi:hypothetical protein ABZ635_07300 [Nocardiopsis sp. NPDC007018]|uniref:hypothetical protein n=1 Tax=Nocardiopsis sp. NPDC007018 TaxID=3155721 RepID=UPI0033CFBC40
MSRTTKGTCRDCEAENVGVCAECRSHCECYCGEPTYESLGIICRDCRGEECFCNEPF